MIAVVIFDTGLPASLPHTNGSSASAVRSHRGGEGQVENSETGPPHRLGEQLQSSMALGKWQKQGVVSLSEFCSACQSASAEAG